MFQSRGARVMGALLALVALLVGGLLTEPGRRWRQATADTLSPYPIVRFLGNLEDPAIDESSGVTASRARPGLFWTHNDSGDGPFLYRFNREGKRRGVWLIPGVTTRDAEDCAAGPGPEKGRSYLYFGDIGDNAAERTDCVVWRVPEPDLPEEGTAAVKENPHSTATAEALPFVYPDGAHNSEALMVHPTNGDVYLITKERTTATSGVYRFPRERRAGRRQTLLKVADLRLDPMSQVGPSLVTGGDIAPDGKKVILRDYSHLYELTLPEGSASFDEIWKQKPRAFPSPLMIQAEGVCYGLMSDALYLTSEQLPAPFYELKR